MGRSRIPRRKIILKDIQIGDVVKFVPHYASSGMQGASLTLQMPKYECLALVYRVYTVKGIGHAHVMLTDKRKKIVGFAGIDTLFRLP